MKKLLTLYILVTLFSTAGYAQESDPIGTADTLFKSEQYKEGLLILKQTLRNEPLDTSQRAEIMGKLAICYETFIGDINTARLYYKKILRQGLPQDHPSADMARKALDRLKSLEERYKEANNRFDRIRNHSIWLKTPSEISGDIREMEELAQVYPEYYRLAELYYMIGRYHLALEHYKAAYDFLDKSIKLKPGIYLTYPVKARKEKAYRLYTHSIILNIVYGILSLLLLLTLIMVYISRPWKWIRLRHLALWLLVIILWPCIFYGSFIGLTKYTDAEKSIQWEAHFLPDVDVHSELEDAGSEIVHILCVYGLIGLIGVSVFAVGTGRLKRRRPAVLMNILFACLLFISLTTVFYLRHCDEKSEFYGQEQFMLKRNLVFILSNPDNYIEYLRRSTFNK